MKGLLIFVGAVLLASATALAGERLLGVISSTTATKSNGSSSFDGGQAWWDGGYDMPFCIPQMSSITTQCSDDGYIGTDLASVTTQTGIFVPATVPLPTSVGSAKVQVATQADGGGQIWCAQVAMLPSSMDAGVKTCKVFERDGRE